MACRQGQDPEHTNPETASLVTQPRDRSRNGPRPGQAQRRRAVHDPKGQPGRPSKSLTLDQAKALLDAAEGTGLHAYVVLSLLTGARTEELPALTWAHVDLDGRPNHNPPLPPCIHVWRSVRAGGDTKTRKSRRTLALPARCVSALAAHYERQGRPAGDQLVFTTSAGTALDRHNVLRAFRSILKRAGLDSHAWTPRELRHSFVSLLSSNGVSIEDIADLCGHAATTITETAYRHQLRPVLLSGAVAMDRIFGDELTPTTLSPR